MELRLMELRIIGYNTVVLINACKTTKIYCRPGCPPGRRTKKENRANFDSIEPAERAGYRACKVCKPDVGEYGPWVPRP